MITLNNDFSPNICPLCCSSIVFRVSQITYEKPIQFSTNQVFLLHQPELWRCTNCKSAFIKNAVRELDSISLYQSGKSAERWNYNSLFEETRTQEVVNYIGSLLKDKKNVLDVGCNTGEFLDFAQRFECKTFGVEYSESSLEILQLKGHVTYSSLDEIQERFDVIAAFDLIEHLYDVPNFLKRCFELLKDKGSLVIFTGNINSISSTLLASEWWYLKYPEHIVFPSKKYFKHQKELRLTNWIRSYYSKDFQNSVLSSAKYLISSLLRRRTYSGFPPLELDHVLVTLERKKNH